MSTIFEHLIFLFIVLEVLLYLIDIKYFSSIVELLILIDIIIVSICEFAKLAIKSFCEYAFFVIV